METDDEGDITMRTVVEHIKAVEAGSGNNLWVSWGTFQKLAKYNEIFKYFSQVNNKLKSLLHEPREITHVQLDEFLVAITNSQYYTFIKL